jgi:cbb3-type cytochrome oxidase cytochrome c subunit
MNFGPLVFLAAFFAVAGSWCGFVLAPQLQVGHLQQDKVVGTGNPYPLARPGLAQQGLQVYRANGCASCHSQQIRQTGTVCDVLLTDAGTNHAALIAGLLQAKPSLTESDAKALVAKLPQPIVQGQTKEQADAAAKVLNAAGGKALVWIAPVGPDIARGWGQRRTVAEDFLYDYPVMPGSQRVGPDLANVGMRLPDANWHLLHLYAPQHAAKGSTMPPYRYLFDKRKIDAVASPDALVMPTDLMPPPGYEIVPKGEAKALVAYLLSLRADAPLFVSPFTAATPAPESTNAPASTATTNAPATNPK